MTKLTIDKIVKSPAMKSLFLMKIRMVSLGIKFVLTLYIARFMGFDTLGGYGLVSAASIVAPAFLGLALMTVISRRAITQTYEEITESLGYYVRFMAICYGLVFAASFYVDFALAQHFLIPTVIAVVFLEHINNDFYTLFLNLSKPVAANMLQFVRTAGWMIPFMGGSYFFPDYRTHEVLLLSWVGGGILTLAGYVWLMRAWPWQAVNARRPLFLWLKDEFKLSKTVYATGCLSAASQYLNQFFITTFLGLELNGVYVYFTQVTAAATNLIHTGLIQLARPKLVRAHKAGDPGYLALYEACRKNVFLGSMAMALIMVPVLYVITMYLNRPLAMEWFPVFGVVLAAFVLNLVADVQGLVFYSQHRDDLTLKSFIGSLIGIIVLSAALLPPFSLWGAAAALAGAAILRIGAQRVYLKSLPGMQK